MGGNRMFFGRGSEYEVDTLKPVTVVTQFLTTDGTDDGELSEMVRYYVQDGNMIASPTSTILGPDDTDTITDAFCQAKKTLFGDVNDYAEKGGSAAMGESLDRGHVMAISLWDDVEVYMLWLDSAFPLNKPATDPGVQRGDCPGGVESTPEYLTLERYQSTYGIEQIENGVKLNFVTDHEHGTNVGSRLYMLDESGEKYKMFYLKNREFAMTFDVSHAFCGMNGAMYFVEMDQDGGKGLGANAAGAAYGTGYCDAQCPHDIKFISGEANSINWNGNPDDPDQQMGVGKYGSCCAEMDIWEANSMANAYTPHPCDVTGQLKCEGTDCGDNVKGERYDGVCDKDGCDINHTGW